MSEQRISLEDIRGALRAAGDPWEAGVTSVSSLPIEEQKRYVGVTPPAGELTAEEAAQRALKMQSAIRQEAIEAIALPSAYDLRNVGGSNFITSIKDQGACGACVGFGTIATVEGTLRVQRGDPTLAVDLSEAHLFFCHAREGGYNCSTGWWPQLAFEAMQNKGVVDDACYPYNLSRTDCTSLCTDAASRLTKITGFQNVTGNVALIKEYIATKGPVSACFQVYSDFFSYRSGIYKHVSGGAVGGHCVSIVGYNDSAGYWICKNSWGTGWGESGFFNIAYGECAIDTWLNHGVDGIENTGWQDNRKVTGLWTINEDRNAWAYFAGLGWRKISSDNENIFFDMLAQLVAAKASGAGVRFYEEKSVIKQMYIY